MGTGQWIGVSTAVTVIEGTRVRRAIKPTYLGSTREIARRSDQLQSTTHYIWWPSKRDTAYVIV